MLSITDLKLGTKIIYKNEPHEVVYSELSKLGRGGSFIRTKLKNLKTQALIDHTFKGNEQISPADTESKTAQFLYKDEQSFYFMNQDDFSQFSLTKSQVGSSGQFLPEESIVEILYFSNEPISVNIPIKVKLKVVYTEPGLKGDTVSSPSKPAELETGAKINVPIFIKTNDQILIDTRSGTYLERAKQ